MEENAIDPILDLLLLNLFLADFDTGVHSYRTASIAKELTFRVGLGETEGQAIFLSALLHDLGKSRLPPSILKKQEPLSEPEWEKVRRHPEIGYQMISEIPHLRPFADISYCHHERWDGKGYPRGLAGEEIPFAARVFTLVDLWDALRSDRPYRFAWDDEKTICYLKFQAGKRLDPQIVRQFLPGLIGMKKESIPDPSDLIGDGLFSTIYNDCRLQPLENIKQTDPTYPQDNSIL